MLRVGPAEPPTSLPLSEQSPAQPSTPAFPPCEKCGYQFTIRMDKCPKCKTMSPMKAAVPAWARLSEDSQIKDTAIQIYLMRGAGMTDEAIAQNLGLAVKTLHGYLYRAGKNGWLDDLLFDPKDRLEHKAMHKVIRNLEEALDDDTRAYATGQKVKTQVALKIAENTLFPKLAPQGGTSSPTMIGVKVQIVGGAATQVREGTVNAAPAYIEGEVDGV